jgi:hypothetical protein
MVLVPLFFFRYRVADQRPVALPGHEPREIQARSTGPDYQHVNIPFRYIRHPLLKLPLMDMNFTNKGRSAMKNTTYY